MNRRMVFHTTGKIVLSEAAMLLLPVIVALIYREKCVYSLLISAGIALVCGLLLIFLFRPQNKVIYAREGFAIVALAWLFLSAIGALPFTLSGQIPHYIDAFFETVSGFTTTGASIIENVEKMSHGLLFWRSFTHWVGGMGILVFAIAILPGVSERSIHILRAEMPGPIVGKLVPRAKNTARVLYIIYFVLTALEIIMLLTGGMSFFESVVHSFGTAGTGGFGVKADSIASYSPYLQWVITVFMLLFGINFNLYFLMLIGRFREAIKSTELWVYLGIILVAAVVIFFNIYPLYGSIAEVARLSGFQVASIITTTGYATADFNQWPGLSRNILLLLMFFGACAGSTGGGFKISRVVILVKSLYRELVALVSPRSVRVVRFEGKRLDENALHSVSGYFIVYVICFILILLMLAFDDFDFLTNFSAAASCLNNIGPGFNVVGPASNYSAYSTFSKLVLSFAMLFGRLEIYPMLLTLSPKAWIKKR